MAAPVNATFGTFQDGGDLVDGDIVVGLRTGLNTRFLFKADLGLFLPLAGGTMSGAIDMDDNTITGVPSPSASSDAVNKAYVDALVAGEALSRVDDTNVTLTLGGTPLNVLLHAVSLTLGWTGQLSVPRGGTGAATFTAYSLICGGTTATGAFQNVVGVGTLNQVLISQGAGALPIWGSVPGVVPAALTKVDDSNVTVTLGGTPATSLLQAVSLTLGWTGQLSVARGGTGLAAITAHNLLIGNATSAPTLLPPSATSGVPLISQGAGSDPAYGTAVVAGGGTGNTTFTAFSVLCAGTTATGAFQNVVGLGNAGEQLTSNGAGLLPTWQAASSSGTVNSGLQNQLAYYAANGTAVSGLATLANGVLVTSAGSVPSISTTLPSGLTIPGYAHSGANSDITSLTGLTGTIQAPTGITSSAGLNLLTFGYTASAVNYFSMTNSAAGSPLQLLATGSDATVALGLYSKGGFFFFASNPSGVPARVAYYAGDNLHYTSLGVASGQAVNLDLTLPATDGSNLSLLQTNGSGVLSFTGAPTGTGIPVLQTSPSLITPTIGVASATSINFGGTALANYLVSTWTPIVTLVGGAGNTVPVYSTNTGVYTRIGNVVYYNILLTGDGGAEGAGTGQIVISLPITASALNSGFSIGVNGAGFNNATRYQLSPTIGSGATGLSLFYWSTITAFAAMTGADQNNTNRNISIQGFYYV